MLFKTDRSQEGGFLLCVLSCDDVIYCCQSAARVPNTMILALTMSRRWQVCSRLLVGQDQGFNQRAYHVAAEITPECMQDSCAIVIGDQPPRFYQFVVFRNFYDSFLFR